MPEQSLPTGYARGIAAVAHAEGALERVADELYSFAQAVAGHPELRDRLTDPAVESATKLDAVQELLSGAHPQTVAAVTYVLQAGRARLLSQIAEAVAEESAEQRGASLAQVRTAKALSTDQQQRLAAAVERATGHRVELQVTTDPGLVGGVIVRVGDTVIDGSVAKRLDDLRSRLTTA